MANLIDDLENEDLMFADEQDLLVDNDLDLREQNPDTAVDGTDATTQAIREPVKKRVVRNPQPSLNADRLRGPRGLSILESWFKDVKLKGKGYERDDLDVIMCRLELWTHRLFPKFTFDDALSRIEKLGHKSQVSNYVKRIRLGLDDELDRQIDVDEIDVAREKSPEVDPFDDLLRTDTGPSYQTIDTQPTQSVNSEVGKREIFGAPHTQIEQTLEYNVDNASLTAEQRERMVRNRLLAEERRMARAKARREEVMTQGVDENIDSL